MTAGHGLVCASSPQEQRAEFPMPICFDVVYLCIYDQVHVQIIQRLFI